MLHWKRSDCSKAKPTLSNWNQTITWIYQCVKILVQIRFCQIDTSWSHLVRGNLNWEKYSPKTMDKTVGLAFWLMWRAQFTVGGATSGQIVLSCIRKQPEKTIRSQSVIMASASKFLPWLSSARDGHLSSARQNWFLPQPAIGYDKTIRPASIFKP